MPRVIAYDLTRLFLGPLSRAPRGIDRVDMALAERFFDSDDSSNVGILPTPWGIRAFNSRIVRRGVAHLQHLWADTIDQDAIDRGDAPRLQWLIQNIHGNPNTPQSSRINRFGAKEQMLRMFAHLRATGLVGGSNARQSVPQGAVYLNIGQIGLAVPLFHRWLDSRPDVTPVIMLHDVIPLEYPHLVDPGSVAHHARMLRTTARHAGGLLFTTHHACETVMNALGQIGHAHVPSYVRGLPLPAAYTKARSPVADLKDDRYFLAISTIEPRKNQRLLIRVWQRLIARLGPKTPHLILAGSRGWDADLILAPLAGDPVLARHVHPVSGLSSPALASLTLSAQGMLCPSFAEGFGLSVLEANAMGLATIASDIPAHREIAAPGTLLLPPDDDEAWERAILPLATGPRRDKSAPPHHIPETLDEASYHRDVALFLGRCAR